MTLPSKVIRVHVHTHPEYGQGGFVANGYSEMLLWLAGWSRKPIYAINIKEKPRGRSIEEEPRLPEPR